MRTAFEFVAVCFLSFLSVFVSANEHCIILKEPYARKTGLIFQDPSSDPRAIKVQQVPVQKGSASYLSTKAISHFNLDYLPPVRSQGGQGSCTAWAVGYYLKSYQENRDAGRTDVSERALPENACSPAFLYNMIHVEGDHGSYHSDAFRVLHDFGCPSLAEMAYNDSDYTTWPDEDDFRSGIPARAGTDTGGDYYYMSLSMDDDLDQLKQLLLNGQIAVFSINVWGNYDNIHNYSNIYAIADKTGSNRGGHAQTVVGFDDSIVTPDGVGAFRAVNSWGTGWGDNGFYWISYEAMKTGNDLTSGNIRWTDDYPDYVPEVKAVFKLSHLYSRETTVWIKNEDTSSSKYFFDFTVRSANLEYRAYPDSNIVLDLTEWSGNLTVGTTLSLNMSDSTAVTNGEGGVVQDLFIFGNGLAGYAPGPIDVADDDQGALFITLFSSTNPSDFTRDGKSDILWHNTTSGGNLIWEMDGATVTTSNSLAGIADTNWDIVGKGDFDADGNLDIFWRNNSTGANIIWFMNGIALDHTGNVTPVSNLEWAVRETADFNGDGKADILWRRTTGNGVILWLMDGNTLVQNKQLPGIPSSDWDVHGTGDFDGDGDFDILWRNSGNGGNIIWFMNGSSLGSVANTTPVANLEWAIRGTADFSGDGKADILWRRTTGNGVILWLMDGATLVQNKQLPGIPSADWDVHDGGDYDGDMNLDILWRNSATGGNLIWFMNGAGLGSVANTTPVSTSSGWEVR